MSKKLVQYNWLDSCLLIVNANETINPFDEEEIDTSKVNFSCFENKYPIPNFLHATNSDTPKAISLDSTFNIYVLDSKAGSYLQYNLPPLKSMPRKWSNGYSRGFAISKANSIVVYWLVIW